MDIPIPSWVLEDSRRDVYKIYFYYDMTLVPVSAITSWASSDSLRNSLGTTEQFCKRHGPWEIEKRRQGPYSLTTTNSGMAQNS